MSLEAIARETTVAGGPSITSIGDLLTESTEEVMKQILGLRSAAFLMSRLKVFKVTHDDGSIDTDGLREFSAALRRIFNFGAKAIEILITRDMYRKANVFLDEWPERSFEGCIKDLADAMSKHGRQTIEDHIKDLEDIMGMPAETVVFPPLPDISARK